MRRIIFKERRYEGLRKKVEETQGKRCFYVVEIGNIIYNLGGKISESTILEKLKQSRITPREKGINPHDYGGVNNNITIYPETSVFTLLQELDQQGKITLGGDTMDDLIKREFHRRKHIKENLVFKVADNEI